MERACRSAGVPLRIISVRSTPSARSKLTRLRPQVIVIDSIAIPIAAPLAHWAQTQLGARVILLMHMPTNARGARALLRAADHVVAVSPSLTRTLGVPRSRLTTIPPGRDGVPRAARRARRRRDDAVLRVLSVANWSPSKGTATLVAAAARVPEVRLDLVGDSGAGVYRGEVLARIRKIGARVVIHGALGAADLARRYAEADVFALPTEQEGYGTVFAEALEHGLPVIGSNLAPVRAIVGDAGLFVPARRVRPLVSALRLMSDTWLRRRLARNARSRARALPSWAGSQRVFVALVTREMRAAIASR
jgi:glycosyltransferase involved in cell wall biosynthesis